eukprot:644245-Prymnesium_polylepis.1
MRSTCASVSREDETAADANASSVASRGTACSSRLSRTRSGKGADFLAFVLPSGFGLPRASIARRRRPLRCRYAHPWLFVPMAAESASGGAREASVESFT